eukprot:GHVS01059477.1.p1 GENE.GHVS01059477.1~~GHVS01059477.1.p1  ORF type:complete len:181 (+),score=27.97 GHVS01059477.1:53-595(+)
MKRPRCTWLRLLLGLLAVGTANADEPNPLLRYQWLGGGQILYAGDNQHRRHFLCLPLPLRRRGDNQQCRNDLTMQLKNSVDEVRQLVKAANKGKVPADLDDETEEWNIEFDGGLTAGNEKSAMFYVCRRGVTVLICKPVLRSSIQDKKEKVLNIYTEEVFDHEVFKSILKKTGGEYKYDC